MRKRHWLAGLLSGWLSVVGGQAFAQSPPIAQGSVSNPDQIGMLPAPYSANYGTYPEQYSGGVPAGYPPNANPWPNVSPYYGPGVDQTVNDNGLWFRRIMSGDRQYYFTVEALLASQNLPHSSLGAPNVNIIPNYVLTNANAGAAAGAAAGGTGGTTSPFPDNTSQFQQRPAGTSTLGTPDREESSTGGAANGGVASTGSPGVFVVQDMASVPNYMNTAGVRGTWGWWNPDSTGFQASIFWTGRMNSGNYIGDPIPFDPTLYTDATFLQTALLNQIHAFAGIPLGGADTDQNGLPGVVQPFDLFYRVQYTSQVGGANADFIANAIFERPALMVRPMYGMRYLNVGENFQFNGADSGLGYTINVPANAGSIGVGGATGTTTGNLSPVTLEAGTSLNIMYSQLASQVKTQLAGPEIGFRLDVGKEKLKVWTTTKLGLLVNDSTRQLSGYNIGDAYYQATNGTITNPTVMPRNNSAQTAFFSQKTSTSMSPMFEQSIFGKANLFQFVPILNKSKIFSEAEFQMGLTVIYVGSMYRPTDTIDWQAYPANPQLTSKRSTYFTNNFSLGVEWKY